MTRAVRRPVCVACLCIAACAGAPPPDWQLNAKASLERSTAAYLAGNTKVEAVEFARARAELARTGRVDLLARAELTRCAARVASLVFEDCPGFAALAQDAPAAERAYAEYLAGRITVSEPALLPQAHRDVLAAANPAQALRGVSDPLARLVAAGVLLRSARAEPVVFEIAADTASAQGWSRPLLAWVGVSLRRAEAAGDTDAAARLRRRIDAVSFTGSRSAPP